jgi:hypothetical protein
VGAGWGTVGWGEVGRIDEAVWGNVGTIPAPPPFDRLDRDAGCVPTTEPGPVSPPETREEVG